MNNWDLAARKAAPCDTNIPDTMNVLTEVPTIRTVDGKLYAFVQDIEFIDSEGTVSLFKLDIARNTVSLVQSGFPNTNNWLVDDLGQPLAETEFHSEASLWTLKVKQKVGWRTAKTVKDDFGGPSLLGLGRDGHSILLYDWQNNDGALYELPPDASDWGPPFAVGDNQDYIFDAAGDALIGVHALIGDTDRYTFFNATDQADWDGAVRAFPHSRVTLQSMSADRKRFVVLVDSPTDSPAYALVDINARTAKWIGAEFAGINASDVSPTHAITFKADDGLNLTGYLTTPVGKTAKALPLVVFPHGGPASRDEPGFDWWVQAMASRGRLCRPAGQLSRLRRVRMAVPGSRGFGEWGPQDAD